MSRAAQIARMHAYADAELAKQAWGPDTDTDGDQRWNEAELASAHYASLSPERKAELEKGWSE